MSDPLVATLDAVSVDRRLAPYSVLAAVGLVAALVTGQVAFAAIGLSAALCLARALRHRRVPAVQAHCTTPPARILEGDEWTLDVGLEWSGPAEVDVVLTGVHGHRVRVVDAPRTGPGDAPRGGDRAGVAMTASGGGAVSVTFEAESWGRHELGELVVRVRRPGGIERRDLRLPIPGSVRVLPPSSRVDALVHPARPRAAAGSHPAPTRGPGTDFADLRPYQVGDRLRDVSWTASARSEHPWVVDHHPERSGTVVLVIDGFHEAGVTGNGLDRAARIIWSIAQHHLSVGDRVGLSANGPTPQWLAPVAGRRARWLLLDALLAVRSGGSGSGRAPSSSAARRNHQLPADAFVVGLSPLQSDAFVSDIVHHRRLGRPTAVVGIETADLLPAAEDDVERAARRLWQLDAAVRRANLSRAGVRTVMVADDAGRAVAALSSLAHRSVALPA